MSLSHITRIPTNLELIQPTALIRPYALHKHFSNVRQEAPVIALMIMIAGSAFALSVNHIWPLIWAAGFLTLFAVDTWFAGWLLRTGRDHLRTKTAAIQLGAMCALTVCTFMIAPIAMISTGDLALAIAATSSAKPVATPADIPVLPEPLRSYLGGDVEALKWKALGRG
eukprot:gene17079-23495_t